MIKSTCKPYKWWVDKVSKCEPFTFVRYGDGEWHAICHGRRTKNGDGHTLRNPQMRKQLIKSILQPGQVPNYYRSVWMDDQCQPHEALARRWIPEHASQFTWYNALWANLANNKGKNYPFIQCLRNLDLPIVTIGPKHLRKLPQAGVFDYAHFIEVPYKTAYFARDRIIKEAIDIEPPVCYTIHAGPPSPVLTWLLWKERGDSCMILDLGSVFDGYGHAKFGGKTGGGKITRKFWRRFATPEILRRNLTGK